MSENCDAIAIFPIYSQFGAIRRPGSERMVCKTYIFINSNLLSYKIPLLLHTKTNPQNSHRDQG